MLTMQTLGRWGRLGNQMFQYAALKGISVMHDYNMLIPQHYKVEVPDQVYELFKAFRLINLKTSETCPVHQWPRMQRQIRIPQFEYQKNIVENLLPNTDISGSYCQSWKYFDNVKDLIRQDFEFNFDVISKVKPFVESQSQPFFLNVRRGDYLKYKDHHPTLPLSYYQEALKKFDNTNTCIIVSDDVKWCKENFKQSNVVFTDELGKLPGYYDMAIMSLCNGGIMANSTFAWWGAWLQKNRTNPIITPNLSISGPGGWFGPANKYNTDDLLLDDWIQLK